MKIFSLRYWLFFIALFGTVYAKPIPTELLKQYYITATECSIILTVHLDSIKKDNTNPSSWLSVYLAKKDFELGSEFFKGDLLKQKTELESANAKLFNKLRNMDISDYHEKTESCLMDYKERLKERLGTGI